MSWLEKNPVGVVLASACGVLVLVSVVLMFLWSRPAPSGAGAEDAPLPGIGPAAEMAADLGPLSGYRIVTDRPVFDESRRPTVGVDDGSPGSEDGEIFIAGAPEVMLTGVVMTLNESMVTLRPLNQGESVIAREGEPLEGEYSGWTVTDIEPRKAILTSQEGDTLELDLQVNTRRIAEPPEPEQKPAEVAQADAAESAPGEAGEAPLSRAEEIRQRIAERRAELRREQEMNERARVDDQTRSADQRSQYQNAIRDMIQDRNRSGSDTQKIVGEEDKDG